MSRCLTTSHPLYYILFFFNDTATTEIYTLSLHDALPIYFLKIPLKIYLLSFFVFLASASTFILSEIKYKFHGLSTFLSVGNPHGDKSIPVIEIGRAHV